MYEGFWLWIFNLRMSTSRSVQCEILLREELYWQDATEIIDICFRKWNVTELEPYLKKINTLIIELSQSFIQHICFHFIYKIFKKV